MVAPEGVGQCGSVAGGHKVVEKAAKGAAMAQLRERDCADKYRGRGEPIHLIGVEFGKETHNVVAFDAEPA